MHSPRTIVGRTPCLSECGLLSQCMPPFSLPALTSCWNVCPTSPVVEPFPRLVPPSTLRFLSACMCIFAWVPLRHSSLSLSQSAGALCLLSQLTARLLSRLSPHCATCPLLSHSVTTAVLGLPPPQSPNRTCVSSSTAAHSTSSKGTAQWAEG